jgi:8-oxo-dGTP pyrophosphatase MutT (NUDIX family)
MTEEHAPTRPAATVVILRPGPEGPEVLLLRRSQRSGFFPMAWVFPGGVVEPRDGAVACRGVLARWGEEQRPAAVAALRECYEEAGIWLGEGSPKPAQRQALQQGHGHLQDWPELRPDLGRLLPWSWWITPVIEPKRYDTRFFLAIAEEAEAAHDEVETMAQVWMTPARALASVNPADFFLAPPTSRTLEELAALGSLEEIRAAALSRPTPPLLPRLESWGPGGLTVVLPGDETYPSEAPAPGPKRLVLDEGRWISQC